MRKMLAFTLALLLLLGTTAIGFAEETETFTWWIARGEDTSYYDNYAENPVLQYMLQQPYAGKKLDLQFWQGISGSEKENFNNMLSTGDLADIIDLNYSDYTAATLYEDGYIIDMTPYVEKYMPNYTKLLEENPAVNEFAWSYVGDEKKILFLTNCMLSEPFEGYCYRRDWIAKYGTNPVTGEAFTWSVDENGIWSDDVVFPCGKTDPYYISDWEWMFEIFTRAMADLGITDGYCISLYFHGVIGVGDLYSGFGGGTPWWYRDENGNAAYGGTSDVMRTYLKCMNTWWNKGWLDKSFAQRSGDMFYVIDSKSVHQGKVGMWQGRQSEIGGGMDIDTPWTDGIMVYGAPQPINDVYGPDEHKNKAPNAYYVKPDMTIGMAITPAAEKKDLAVLFAFLDSMYDPDTANFGHNGFSREMMAEMDDNTPWKQMYIKFGLSDGLWDENNGDPVYTQNVDVLLGNAMKMNRITKGFPYDVRQTLEARSALLQHSMDLWVLYDSTATIPENVDYMISPKDTSRKSKIDMNQQTYMAQSAPKFIMGQKGFDINNDKDWANYCKVLTKYGVDKVTQMYQKALEMLKE